MNLETSGSLGVLTLANPPLNLLSGELLEDLGTAVNEAKRVPIRALLLRAEGKVFSAGADVSAFADLQTWTFRCFGLVDKEVSWAWKEFLELPRVEATSDIHCVTRLSRYDNRWEGVAVREILRRLSVKPAAVAVMAHTQEGYTTNIPLAGLER